MALKTYVDRVGPVVDADWLNFIDRLANGYTKGFDSGLVNAYVLAVPTTESFILSAGAIARFITTNANTGASTLNVGGTGVKPVLNPFGGALTGGEIKTGTYTWVEYIASVDSWVLLSLAPQQDVNTFTPALVGSSTPGNQTYALRAAFYVIEGKFVKFWIYILLSAKDGAAAGAAQVTGLPVASRNQTNLFMGVNVSHWGGITLAANFTHVGAYVAPNTQVIQLTSNASNGSSAANLQMGAIANDTELMISGAYALN